MLSDLGVLALSFYRLPLGKSLLARDQLTSFLVVFGKPLCLLWLVSLKVSDFLWEISQLV